MSETRRRPGRSASVRGTSRFDSGRAPQRCDTCSRADGNVAMCTGCYRNRCDRKKCAATHAACFTPDELVD